MEPNPKKRTLHSFFAPAAKKSRVETKVDENDEGNQSQNPQPPTLHSAYPFPIPALPSDISSALASMPATDGKLIDDQVDLDLLYFEPFIPKCMERKLFQFIRAELPFYRVEYKIKRRGIETDIKTPRWTTVFGLDETSRFNEDGKIVDAATRVIPQNDPCYLKYPPRPIPNCLNDLQIVTEKATSCKFNFCLVNYYASGADSISYHSDDERFLGPLPAIASFSLGAKRDFLLKHKPFQPDDSKPLPPETKFVKLPLASGDMILMRGKTQANWLHSIPKRRKTQEDGGRINITFRRALIKGGTENYYNYNIGTGPVYKWNETAREMRVWNKQ